MSASNAAAKKRRAMIPVNSGDSIPNIGGRPYTSPVLTAQPPTVGGQKPSQPPTSQQGFTLQQVIAVIDKRLISLEKNVEEINKQSTNSLPYSNTENVNTQAILPDEQSEFNKQANLNFQMINENLNEYDSRFEILVNEIADIKTIVLKLQSYTMDVNKMLLEEKQLIEPLAIATESNQNNQGDSLGLNDIYTFSTKEAEEMTYNLLPPATDDNTEVSTI